MVNKFLDLVILDGNEALVATVLAVLLLEHDARDPARLPLLGGEVRSRGGAWDGAYGLRVFGVRLGKVIEVGQRCGGWFIRMWSQRHRRREVAEVDGGGEELAAE